MEQVFQSDERDLEILKELRKDAKQSLGQLSSKLGIPKSSVYRKINKLEENGVIKGYTVKLDFHKFGKPILAFILISIDFHLTKMTQKEIALEIIKIPEIYDIHILTGEHDMIAKARAESIEELGEVIVNKIRSIEGVGKTLTNVSLQTVAEELETGKL